ncbi:silent information regulator family protein [Planoprotostelium fungivorum]|uniref:Silent information regulator family protein n=1 Tax=Planoprotostelium fungivorum TaxID=1890364 RepID=A0A2P6N0E0_9EUKA|nr:silent information regulator family protein [Planoprotostelium fungivorum]
MNSNTNEDEVDEALIEQCAQQVANAKRVVIFTGAGMSAESGIGTFRGGSGLWSGVLGKLVLGWFGTPIGWNWTPGFAWSQYVDKFYNPMRDAQPNPGHYALAQLESKFPNSFDIITQNVDGLHQRAGSDPSIVYEVHGTVRRHRCIKNGHIYPFDSDVIPTTSPRCLECDSGLRPDCVLFTESLPHEPFSRSDMAVSRLARGDVMIVVGTSAAVYPAAGLPVEAARRGATVMEVNLQPTEFSSLDNYKWMGKRAGVVLPNLVERVVKLR